MSLPHLSVRSCAYSTLHRWPPSLVYCSQQPFACYDPWSLSYEISGTAKALLQDEGSSPTCRLATLSSSQSSPCQARWTVLALDRRVSFGLLCLPLEVACLPHPHLYRCCWVNPEWLSSLDNEQHQGKSLTLFLFFRDVSNHWKWSSRQEDRERNKMIFHSLVHSAIGHISWDYTKPKPGARNFHHVLPCGWYQSIWAITCCLQGALARSYIRFEPAPEYKLKVS